MKKFCLAVLGLITFGSYAQKLDNALLWKISGNGLAKPSYLFGTVHITCDATLDKNILAALDATSQLYLELDMDDPTLQAEMMKGVMMKDGTKMSTLATPEDFQAVNDFLMANLGTPAKALDAFKPAFVSMMLMFKTVDCETPQSYEDKLMKVSQQQNEPVYGLETVADQIAAFDAIPYKEQMDELVKTAKDNMAESKAGYKKMMALYNNKDLNGLMAYMKEEENKMYDNNSAVLLDNRNKAWIPKIEQIIKTNATFFGVGAAHLGGDMGVINLLRKKGYKVEAVK